MKNKDEVFSKFKEFKALIKNHTEMKIKTFHSGNGGEFTSNEFKELCRDSRIKRELTTSYNPQQNGCNVLDTLTDEEDATMSLINRETSPMNMYIHVN